MIWFLILIVLLKLVIDQSTENFSLAPYNVANPNSEKMPLTATDFNKYYFGYPRPTYDVPPKPVAHPTQSFYNKDGPYTYGGYYMGLEFPKYWNKTYDGKNEATYKVNMNFDVNEALQQ